MRWSSVDAPLSVNGVVYNEMKGAFSSPEDMLDREIMTVLYPDTTYFHESGGDPEDIPNLTYEAVSGFPQKILSSVQLLYLSLRKYGYGRKTGVDLDENYLSQYDYLKVDSEIAVQKPFEKPVSCDR